MYRVYLINFGYYLEPEFKSVHEALAYGKSKGFDCAVHGPKGHVASWSIFGGIRWYQGEYDCYD